MIKRIIPLALLAFFLLNAGCGVKGDPVPPATPAEIGTGKPVFKGETDDRPALPGPSRTEPESDDDEQDEE